MSDLLPFNASKVEKAMSEGASSSIREMQVRHGDLWNPATVPVEFIPWLAHALSVDHWNSNWPESVKREVLFQSVAVHRRKGTIGAIRRALEATGLPTQVKEWFETGGSPHSFTVQVDIRSLIQQGEAFNDALIAELSRSVDLTKPVRSHYSIVAYYGLDAIARVGAVLTIKDRIEIHPLVPEEIEQDAVIGLGIVLNTNTRIDVH